MKKDEVTTRTPIRVGVFDTLERADLAVEALVADGFAKDHITVVCPTCGPHDFEAYQKKEPAGAHAPAAAAGGGTIGAVLGGLAAVAGVAATGGIGLLAAGPLLLGAAGGAVAGGLVGAMLTRGMEPEVANFYDQALTKGQILVSVEAPGPGEGHRLDEAEDIMARLGAETVPLRHG